MTDLLAVSSTTLKSRRKQQHGTKEKSLKPSSSQAKHNKQTWQEAKEIHACVLPTIEKKVVTASPDEILESVLDEVTFRSSYPQFNADGRPTEKPIPDEFLPRTEPMIPRDQEDVYEEELENVLLNMALPELPSQGHKSLWAETVPAELVNYANAYIMYRNQKSGPSKGLAMSEKARAFYRRFGVAIRDDKERLVNWMTVFYVVHYMRCCPSDECYRVTEDLFSDAYGLDKYDLERNWTHKREHAIRLLIISQRSGDDFNAVCTLDVFLRFKRWASHADYCIAYNQQSLVLMSYAKLEANGLGIAWIDIGLNKENIPADDASSPYYDSPSCATCNRHHCGLFYCADCYRVQYCSEECRLKDERKHSPLCQIQH
jgi:hypothetical protein